MRTLAAPAPSSLEKNSRASAILPTVIDSRRSRHICCCADKRAYVSTGARVSTDAQASRMAQTHLPLVCSEPTERALLPLGEAHPVFYARILDGVEQVLALKCEVAFEDQHEFAVRKDAHLAYGR